MQLSMFTMWYRIHRGCLGHWLGREYWDNDGGYVHGTRKHRAKAFILAG
jgi:hypothetical protein